jgi:hypothetical protein
MAARVETWSVDWNAGEWPQLQARQVRLEAKVAVFGVEVARRAAETGDGS